MNWYYAAQGSQLGPVSLDELKAKLASGEVKGTDLVWREGLPDWAPASTVAELQSASAVRPPEVSAAPLTASVPVESPVVSSQPYQAPHAPMVAGAAVGVQGHLPSRTSGLAITSLVLGLISISLGCCFGGLTLLPAIMAVVMGHVSRSQMKRDATLKGKGLALGGLISGYLGVVCGVLLLAIGILISTASPQDIDEYLKAFPEDFQRAFREGMEQRGHPLPSAEPGAGAPVAPSGEVPAGGAGQEVPAGEP